MKCLRFSTVSTVAGKAEPPAGNLIRSPPTPCEPSTKLINLPGRNVGTLQCLAGGSNGKGEGRFTFADNMALLDTRARGNPLVGCFNDLFEIGVGKDPFGYRAPPAGNSCVFNQPALSPLD